MDRNRGVDQQLAKKQNILHAGGINIQFKQIHTQKKKHYQLTTQRQSYDRQVAHCMTVMIIQILKGTNALNCLQEALRISDRKISRSHR